MEQTDEDRLTAALLDQFFPAGDDVHGMQTAMNALVAVAARVIWCTPMTKRMNCVRCWWTRANAEICLLATRGRPKRQDNSVRRLVVSPRREHSRKPDAAYDGMRRLVAGPYLELFARTRRPGWDVAISNEADRFSVHDKNAGGDPAECHQTGREGQSPQPIE